MRNDSLVALPADGTELPEAFTTTSAVYREFVRTARLRPLIATQIRKLRAGADPVCVGATIRTAFVTAELPSSVAADLTAAYRVLGGDGTAVVIRGAAPATGQTVTFTNVSDTRGVLIACKRCFASLFTDRAISLREEHGLDHLAVAMTVEVQRTVRRGTRRREGSSPGRLPTAALHRVTEGAR